MKMLGLKIRQRREELGLTQEDVAGKSMATRTLQRLEDGDGNPTLSTLLEIAVALKMPASELLAIPGEKPAAIQLHPEPRWPELSRLLQYYGDASVDERLLGLYMLSQNSDYLKQYAELGPDQAADASILTRILATS